MIAIITSEWAAALARWAGYLAASLLVGVAVLRIQRPLVSPHLLPTHRLVRLAGTVLALAALTRMSQQALLFAAAPDEALAMVGTLRATPWGLAWTVQLLAALSAAVLPGAWTKQAKILSLSLAVMAAIPPAFQGHGFGAETLTTQAVVAHMAHLLAAGTWIGTLAVLTIVWLPTAPAANARDWIARFSPWALTGAATLGATGLFLSWIHVGELQMVWGSGYGRTLLLKIALVVLIVLLGAINWKRLAPALMHPGGTDRLRASARREVALGALALLVTAFLVATSLPGE